MGDFYKMKKETDLNIFIGILESVGYRHAGEQERYEEKTYFYDYENDKIKLVWTSSPNDYNGNNHNHDNWLWLNLNEKRIGNIN